MGKARENAWNRDGNHMGTSWETEARLSINENINLDADPSPMRQIRARGGSTNAKSQCCNKGNSFVEQVLHAGAYFLMS